MSRLSRFKRALAVVPMLLTERDREIIRLVHRHRFLRSPQIVALVGKSSQSILRRLQLLYHHGYLERPRAQIDYYREGGSRPMVYGLGNKSGELMRPEYGIVIRQLSWGEKNRSAGRIFLDHALLVSDVMVAIKLACRKTEIRLLTEEDLTLERDGPQAFRWKVNVNSGGKLTVIPDRVFALEFQDQTGQSNRAYFFLEADRGTMPVKRRTLSQTSFYRKLLAYEATWAQSIHRTRFGFHRFRVLTVTSNPARVKSLVEACGELKQGHGLFLFADWKSFEKAEDTFSSIWHTGRQGETASLLD